MSDEPSEQPIPQPPPPTVAEELAAITMNLAMVTENVTSLSVRIRLAGVDEFRALLGIDGPPPATESAAQRLRVQIGALDRALELIASEIANKFRNPPPADQKQPPLAPPAPMN